jgi:FO synthase
VDPEVVRLADALAREPLDELCARAAAIRDARWGGRITWSPKVFIPLTMLCRDRCGYCTFAKPPAHLTSAFLDLDQVLAVARSGAAAGCREALFTLGEAPEDRWPVAARWLAARGHPSTVAYLAEAAAAVRSETGLLPHANAGALDEADLARLRRECASQGMMIETLAGRLAEPGGPHHGAPDKAPARRLRTLEAAGRLRIPFTTGILVGIGETFAEQVEALVAIADAHRRHGHVQEVIVQNFLPKPGTAMHRHPPAPLETHLRAIAAARILLPPDVHVQAPPNLAAPGDLAALVDAGIDDWGGVSPVTADHVNPERPWPAVEVLAGVTAAAGKVLVPRLTVYPEFAGDAGRWLDPQVAPAVRAAADAEGYARDDDWAAGGGAAPPVVVTGAGPAGAADGPGPWAPVPARAGSRVAEVLDGLAAAQDPGEAELVALLEARGADLQRLVAAADDLRRATVGDAVTFVRNRNINYTNVCTFRCRFCAFSKGPLSLNLRGAPYLLDRHEIQRRVREAVEHGATEVCLQGGIHPDFDGGTYLDIIRAVKEVAPGIHVHGFTALEVTEGARRLGVELREYLVMARDAGLASLPGTAAEILDDEVRAVICPDKLGTEAWLETHRVAHEVGLASNVTIMFGHVERPVHVARHLLRTRDLARRTGGFTEFVPLPFVHMATPLYLQGRCRRGPTFREVVALTATARLAYRDCIDHVQVSWVKVGPDGARQLLAAGADDLGGTLMDENISRAAGADHGQELDDEDFAAIVAPLGRPLRQRTTLYRPVHTTGRRLRPRRRLEVFAG